MSLCPLFLFCVQFTLNVSFHIIFPSITIGLSWLAVFPFVIILSSIGLLLGVRRQRDDVRDHLSRCTTVACFQLLALHDPVLCNDRIGCGTGADTQVSLLWHWNGDLPSNPHFHVQCLLDTEGKGLED